MTQSPGYESSLNSGCIDSSYTVLKTTLKSTLLLTKNNLELWKSFYYHYYEFPYGVHAVKKHYGIRTERYKLIHFYNDIDDWEMYDLEKDPYEMNNIYNEKSASNLRDSLKNALNDLRVFYKDTVRLETVNKSK